MRWLIRDKAIDYLSKREHSRLELKRKLLQKSFSSAEIDTVLDQLKANNLQSDERFAESYIRYRKQAGFGPLRIIAELQERGVAEYIISKMIDKNDDEWKKHMIVVCEKKFSITEDKAHKNDIKKFRFLSTRGFSAEMINQFLFR